MREPPPVPIYNDYAMLPRDNTAPSTVLLFRGNKLLWAWTSSIKPLHGVGTKRITEQCPALSVVCLSAHYLTLSCLTTSPNVRPFTAHCLTHKEETSLLRQGDCKILGLVRIGGHEALPRASRSVALSCSLKSNACRDWSAARIPPNRSEDRDQLFRLVLFHSPAGLVPGPASSAVSATSTKAVRRTGQRTQFSESR
jgi:hypothetical protein